jgi:hypothetical protein
MLAIIIQSKIFLSSCLVSKNLQIKIYKIVILPVVLYGCETWSLTLKEEHRLRAFENRMLRRIFGPKREEDGSWRKLHDDEHHSLYSSPNISVFYPIQSFRKSQFLVPVILFGCHSGTDNAV